MGHIISISEALERLSFTNLKKGRIYKGASIVLLERRDGGGGPDVALVKLESGEWTVLGSRHVPNGNWAVMDYGLATIDKNVLKALVSAGAITQEEIDRHLSNVEEASAMRQRRRDISDLDALCKKLGIETPVTPA